MKRSCITIKRYFVCTYSYILCFLLGIIFWWVIAHIFSEKTQPSFPEELPTIDRPKVTATERNLYPVNSVSFADIRERSLYGEYIQDLGPSVIGLKLLSTEDFGPYTVIKLVGDEENEVVRIGYYEITKNSELVLHLRFKENSFGELELDPLRETWVLKFDYPFIQLINDDVILLATDYSDESRDNIMDVYNEANRQENESLLDTDESDR